MQRVIIPAGEHIFNEQIEGVFVAVVGADDMDTPAPHGHGHGRLEQLADVINKGGLIDHQMLTWTPFTPQVARISRKGLYLVPAGKRNIKDMDIFAVIPGEDLFANRSRCTVEDLRPGRAVLNKPGGHLLVVGDIIGVGPAL